MHVPDRFAEQDPAVIAAMVERAGLAVLVTHGPDAYVSPGWLPSKAEGGRVAPTWNYEAVHVHGRLAWFEDCARLLEVVTRISDRMELGRPRPWAVADAPAAYVDRLLAGIVGFELRPTRIEAKRKLSQHQNKADRDGAMAGLAAENPLLAELMRGAAAT